MALERKIMLLLATVFMAAMMFLLAAPVFAAEHGRDDGATIEEFVCFRSTGEEISLGTGKVITTPSGKTHIVCTGKPISR